MEVGEVRLEGFEPATLRVRDADSDNEDESELTAGHEVPTGGLPACRPANGRETSHYSPKVSTAGRLESEWIDGFIIVLFTYSRNSRLYQ
ncbi:unnamed protein product [Protopolystoma xenopodis]|uniref:Uncharacterized protein n=1 Tax=Protopolystoma xenopodis TaxID=117903 RepID=A0A3S5B2G5_9PLAT|nr:unnamed protein product [Protopolystoma xenopodis]